MAVHRRLLPTEAGQLAEHLLRLSPEQRGMRFMHAASDEVLRHHVRDFDWRTGLVIGFFEAGVLRGAPELQGERFGTCEVAVTVEAAWQHHGVGTDHLHHEDGEVSGEIRLAPPTWISLARESIANGLGWMSALVPVAA